MSLPRSSRPRPAPPRPDLIRFPRAPYGWLDAGLVRQGWLRRVGPRATAVLAFLALVADREGVSYYRRERIALALDMNRGDVDQALEYLLADGLVAFSSWSPGGQDGVWQLLPLPAGAPPPAID
jgi:hypothetical protein